MNISVAHHEHSGLKLIRNDALNPPQKPLPFIAFDSSKSTAWLNKNVQHSWWQRDYQVPIASDYDMANICQLHRERITKLSGGLIKLPAASTASEWCLIREIVWMLQVDPDTSTAGVGKFFSIDSNENRIVSNRNVSLASVTVDGMQSILNEFAVHMTILYRFRQFVRSVFGKGDDLGVKTDQAPHTIECYADAVQGFLTSMSSFLLTKEDELIRQDPMVIHSVVNFYTDMQPHIRQMQQLHTIHQRCYADFRKHSNHVSAMYLLATLINEIDTAATAEHLNLASELFVASIKFYLVLFNDWWIEGRFDDWRNEFLIEKMNDIDVVTLTNPTQNIYRVKAIGSDDGNAKHVLETIRSCRLLQMMSDQSLEAGYIINILYNLDKLNDMRQQQLCDHTSDLYESFVTNVFDELKKFDKRLVTSEDGELSVGDPSVGDASAVGTLTETAEIRADTSEPDTFNYDLGVDCNPLLALVFENAMQSQRTDGVNGQSKRDLTHSNEITHKR